MLDEFSTKWVCDPSSATKLLIDYLKHGSDLKKVLPRRRLNFVVGNERLCYVLLKGRVMIHRGNDDLAMATVQGPAVIGLSNLHQTQMRGYIKTFNNCDIVTLKTDFVNETIKNHNLWEPLAYHLMGLAGKLFHSYEDLTGPSAYDIVSAQLYALSNEESSFRLNVTAESYIRDKTHLSRSGVMRILSALKEGGYIEMQRGVLLNIIKLPDRF
ncbi:winged helix-turn-helix transcriptional regulator [Enterobacter quasiroggenkampii]|uniref:winged helix-turn-helix transcriptional regulator n=1 Tax=Enterobacter quasiroggenkampii TaxID=2497436 RepID=UPI0021CEF19A|nr:winged helix-turn-helix transcriptional regulator [Enterobacter quasiroggenkampii]MCU6383569.1 helix-turn-helix domain-containing protein [Enterobacter quasiroggenkampii]MCU6393595.1 helix-turn-helix domain-containing protein [Enterobacter quasiroggenkampii]MCU6402236.1 helix-turn-helix domain-containing protein [Enterobacter quasiroggenkampii]MCU6415867.1 helix-turn-helix domain-containing protein [Enterobacter quasiroggenkampii]